MSGANADGWDSQPATNAPSTTNVTPTQSSQSADVRGKTSPSARAKAKAKAKLKGLKADVVKDVRATTAFVQQQTDATTPSRWLIGLAAFGLVLIQLRRKHKSLPQRRIAQY
jgi:hypothetical protein